MQKTTLNSNRENDKRKSFFCCFFRGKGRKIFKHVGKKKKSFIVFSDTLVWIFLTFFFAFWWEIFVWIFFFFWKIGLLEFTLGFFRRISGFDFSSLNFSNGLMEKWRISWGRVGETLWWSPKMKHQLDRMKKSNSHQEWPKIKWWDSKLKLYIENRVTIRAGNLGQRIFDVFLR